MVRLSATEVARNFSRVMSRVGAGEEIEIVRNGAAVAELRPAGAPATISATRWRELMTSAPAPDSGFAHELAQARERIGPPSDAWPS